MISKRFPLRGTKVSWGKENLIAVVRDEGGVALIDINSSKVNVIGGFLNFKDISWSENKLACATQEVVMLYSLTGELQKVVKVNSEITAIGSFENGFVIGTEEGELIMINEEGKKIWENKVWDGSIDRVEKSISGYILAVAIKYTLLVVSPKGMIITTNC
jgi:hypothetical protein